MAGHDIIVIGGSAGGIEALRVLIKDLPMDLPAAIFVVVHTLPDRPSLLPTLLNHAGSLLVLHPADGTPIRSGCVYIAPPDRHLLIEGTIVRVVAGPRENCSRPAIDPLFRSAAACYGERVIGVLLSGNLDDGTAGLLAIRRHGGITMVQDPEDAMFPAMPASARAAMPIDHCVRLGDMAQRLQQLVHVPVREPMKIKDELLVQELDSLTADVKEMESDTRAGTSSPYSCPDCGGVLWQIDDEGLLRFRCRVGHAFSTESMMAEQTAAAERALWMALKTLEERASLLSRMIRNAKASANVHIITRYSDELHRAEESASAIRKVLIQSSPQEVSRGNG